MLRPVSNLAVSGVLIERRMKYADDIYAVFRWRVGDDVGQVRDGKFVRSAVSAAAARHDIERVVNVVVNACRNRFCGCRIVPRNITRDLFKVFERLNVEGNRHAP